MAWTGTALHFLPGRTDCVVECTRVVEFIIPMFLNCSTCFGRHTAHHQELKNELQPLVLRTKTYVKPEAAVTVFELLMMGGVSPGTC